MIHVEGKAEPDDFDYLVRIPGSDFLYRVPKPTTEQFNKHAYWQRTLPAMRILYGKICAYCSQWIPHGTGNHSVDHFNPKNTFPELAYEWNNYRYVSARFNSRKGNHKILDPFALEDQVFIIDFVTMLIKPNPDLPEELTQSIEDTIRILKLNTDEDLVHERIEYYELCQAGDITFKYLEAKAPFMAYEMRRQGKISS